MQILQLNSTNLIKIEKIIFRSKKETSKNEKIVSKIISDVKKNKDRALFEFAKKYDKCELTSLKVTEKEINDAYELVPSDFIDSIRQIIKNQEKFQKSLIIRKSKEVSTEEGIKVWREWRPIEKIGLYVPGGRANYPSSVVMVGVPAKVAGCKEIVVCSPPLSDGNINPFVIIACNEVGINQIYKVGGPGAIASMAYGTETIPKTYKIFGAGNNYVTTAKLLVQKDTAIDMPAGPSEILIIADNSANPEWIAADLLSQCEHGPDSAAVLITNSLKLAEEVKIQVSIQTKLLPTKKTIEQSLKNYSAIIIVKDLAEAVNLANKYAPEHLEIVTRNAELLSKDVVNAGSVFLGEYSTEPAGDYATGGNHVLPTNGYSKMYQALSVDSFGKQIEFQTLTKKGLSKIRKTINTLANAEGLPAHARAVNIRFNKK